MNSFWKRIESLLKKHKTRITSHSFTEQARRKALFKKLTRYVQTTEFMVHSKLMSIIAKFFQNISAEFQKQENNRYNFLD